MQCLADQSVERERHDLRVAHVHELVHLGDDGQIEQIGVFHPDGGGPVVFRLGGIPGRAVGIDVERAAVEEMLVDAIGEEKAIFRVFGEFGVEAARFVCAAYVEFVAAGFFALLLF